MDLKQMIDPTGPVALDEFQAKQLLKSFDIPVVDERLAADADEAVEAARSIGYPVVLKGVGRRLLFELKKP